MANLPPRYNTRSKPEKVSYQLNLQGFVLQLIIVLFPKNVRVTLNLFIGLRRTLQYSRLKCSKFSEIVTTEIARNCCDISLPNFEAVVMFCNTEKKLLSVESPGRVQGESVESPGTDTHDQQINKSIEINRQIDRQIDRSIQIQIQIQYKTFI